MKSHFSFMILSVQLDSSNIFQVISTNAEEVLTPTENKSASKAKQTLTSLLENVRESKNRLQMNSDHKKKEAVGFAREEKPLAAMKTLLADVRESTRFLKDLAKIEEQRKMLEMQHREFESYKNFGSDAFKKRQVIQSGVTDYKVRGTSFIYYTVE